MKNTLALASALVCATVFAQDAADPAVFSDEEAGAEVAASAPAESGNGLWGWNISAGANFGFGLKTHLRMSPANAMQALPALTPAVGPTRAAAIAARKPVVGGSRVNYGSGYVDPDSSWGETPGQESETWNWCLPSSAVQGSGADRKFVFASGDAEWGEVVSRSTTTKDVVGTDDDVAYGASVDLSHELFVSEDAKWGVDIAVGVAWMRSANCFKAGGVAVNRSATVERGDTVTEIPGEFFAYPYAQAEDDNTWGNGTHDGDDFDRARYLIDVNDIAVRDRVLSSTEYADSMSIGATGDYEEWELSVVLRPWYDVNDWLCVHGALGVGVTRSSFEYTLNAMHNGQSVYRSSQEFNEWRCYGLVGAGVLARVGRFDLSCDGMFRWSQKDMEINGRDVHGSVEKPWGVLRLGLSYCF